MRRRATSRSPWVVAVLVLGPGLLLASPPPAATSPFLVSVLAPMTSAPSSPEPGSPSSTSLVTVAPGFAPPPGMTPGTGVSPTAPMSVAVGLSLSDASGLSADLSAIYTPGTPLYRHFLSPAALSARYGPRASALRSAADYFSSFGLTVSAEPNGLLLGVQGTASDLAAAFHTTFEEYRIPSGRLVVSHPTPATLPSDIPWAGVLGLGNLTPIVPAVSGAVPARPLVTPDTACAGGPGGLSPCEIQTAYDSAPLIANGTNGTGERIGIVDAYSGEEPQPQLASDLADFAAEFDLPSGGVQYLYPVPTSENLNSSSVNAGWGLEEALDIEWARASAPGASIDMTFSPDSGPGLYTAIDSLVASDAVNVLSLSWGEPDVGVFNSFSTPCSEACNASTDGSYAMLGPVLEFAAAEGISVFAASGDCGASDGTAGLATNFPASDPYVTGVGGTALLIGANGTYVSETGWSGNTDGATAPGCSNQGGSGGGYSPFPRPSWQTGLNATTTGRGVPDVALDADAAVSIVYDGSASAGARGTSVGTPIWAGLAAIADQHAGAPLGFLNPSLYRIAAGPNYTGDFHDIVSGNNGYAAGPGWDPVTGLGSPIAAALIDNLTAVPTHTSGAPSAYLFASPRFGRFPLTVSFGVAASGGTGSFAQEGVDFGDGNASPQGNAITYTYENPGVYSAIGWVVDSSGNVSDSSPIAIVVGGGSGLSVELTASNTSPAVGAPVLFSASVSGGTPPYTYNFTFGDGTSLGNTSDPSASHAYYAPGAYCAEVVVADSAEPPDGGASNRVAVTVGGAPAPNCGNDTAPLTISPLPTGSVRDAPADFPALFAVTGGASAPDGLTTSVQYLSSDPYTSACGCAIFRDPGNYTVRAWANDTVNEEVSAVTNVTVAPPLVGVFAVSTDSGPAPLSVEFFATSHGGYLADANDTVWTFGNGHTAVGHTVNQTYEDPGQYVAVAHLSDAGDGNASEAFLIDVRSTPTVEAYGIVGTIDPAIDVPSGTTVQFVGSIVAPPGPEPLTVGWNLGRDYSAFGSVANQTFFGPFSEPFPNTLQVSVSALLPNTVEVYTLPLSLSSFFATEAGGFMPRASAIDLSSHLGPTFGLTPLPVTGLAVVSGPGGPSVVWDFGDGAVIPGTQVIHTYYGTGEYTVAVVGRDGFEDRAVDSIELVANGPLQIFGGPSPSSGVPPVHVTLLALGVGGTGPPYTYRWTFENGSEVNGSTASATYRGLGVYSVTANVTDSSGVSVNRTWTVDVHLPASLTGAEILAAASALGGGISVGYAVGWFRRRPGRPTLSQRRAAAAVRRVV